MSMTVDVPRPADAKLPFWQTIGLSYSTYFHHFIDVLKISWLWLVVLAPLTGVASWLQMSWMAEAMANMKPGRPVLAPVMPIEMEIFVNLASAVMLFAGCSIAVAWHRRLLLDELPGISGGNVVTRSLWHYVGIGIAICLIVGLPAFAIIAPILLWVLPHPGAGLPTTQNPALFLLPPIVSLAATFVMLRLALLLPARAIGASSVTFKQAWNRSRGNAWRIFWGVGACTLPPLLFGQIAIVTLAGFPNPLKLASSEMVDQWVVNSVVLTSFYLLILPISIGFLSHAYRFFFDQSDSDDREL